MANSGGTPIPRRYVKAATFSAIAAELSELSTCDRNKVGAIIVKDGRCISWGYNGAPPGLPHCSENVHGWSDNHAAHLATAAGKTLWQFLEEHGCRNATHAEANAIAAAARQGISTDGAELYVTVSPCATCSRLLIAAGIVRVTFRNAYRDDEGLRILREAGVKIVG